LYPRNIITGFVPVLLLLSLYRCIPPEKIILPGDIKGHVTDTIWDYGIENAYVTLNNTNDTVRAGINGFYIFKNVAPGDYEIEASYYGFHKNKKEITVLPAETHVINFTLNPIYHPVISHRELDFGLDLISIPVSISYNGLEKITYKIKANPNQEWIKIQPSAGELENSDTLVVTISIDRTGLSTDIYQQQINISWYDSYDVFSWDWLNLYVNGVLGSESNIYYKVMKIGTQLWMAENIKDGTDICCDSYQTDNGVIEKYCFDNDCDPYGAYYQWGEIMQYHHPDTGITGITRGICPEGWHVPTTAEWKALIDYLGGENVAGGKLKDIGIIQYGNGLWQAPNTDATNESGFTALPGGWVNGSRDYVGNIASFWTSQPGLIEMYSDSAKVVIKNFDISSDGNSAHSLRCIKDP